MYELRRKVKILIPFEDGASNTGRKFKRESKHDALEQSGDNRRQRNVWCVCVCGVFGVWCVCVV